MHNDLNNLMKKPTTSATFGNLLFVAILFALFLREMGWLNQTQEESKTVFGKPSCELRL